MKFYVRDGYSEFIYFYDIDTWWIINLTKNSYKKTPLQVYMMSDYVQDRGENIIVRELRLQLLEQYKYRIKRLLGELVNETKRKWGEGCRFER